jgi:hypothetical protein
VAGVTEFGGPFRNTSALPRLESGSTSPYRGFRLAWAHFSATPVFPPRGTVSEWRVIRPEPSIGAKNVGKRWATRKV